MPRTYLAEVEAVSVMRACVNLLRQVFHEEVKEERVGIGVDHSDLLSEFVFQKRVKRVPINENKIDG